MTTQEKPAAPESRRPFPARTPANVEDYFTEDPEPAQAQSPKYLIGDGRRKEIGDNSCPSARTITGYSETLKSLVVIQIRCKRWGCRHCGERKISRYGWRVNDASPNRLLTLTVWPELWSTPRAAYDGTARKVTELAIKLRRVFGEFEYFRVLEVTAKGWPHYHLVVRSEYIPQAVISQQWEHLTGARIVDVRAIKRPKDVYFYVVKYLGKQKYIPWTNRRVSWTKAFFRDKPFDQAKSLGLSNVHWAEDHPMDVICRDYRPHLVEVYSRDCWIIHCDWEEPVGIPIAMARLAKRKRN